MHWDAFGNKWLVSEKIGFWGIFCDFFGRCRIALRVLWGVLNITLSFQTFSDVLDNFSYLLSLVIYRERPLLIGQCNINV